MRSEIRIIRYHGVVERVTDAVLERNFHLLTDFREQVHALRQVRIIALSELAAIVASSSSFPPGPAHVITFDDGYANNLLAYEVLNAAKIPFAIFVSTGTLGRRQTNWTAELSLLLLHGEGERIDALGREWNLKARDQRETAYDTIRRQLKVLAAANRREAMQELRRQFPAGETQRLLQQFPAFQMLTWEDLARLSGAGVEIASHGVHHELHHTGQPEAILQAELRDSKAELERRLRHACRAFAFPNGDFVPRSPADIEDAGYSLAVTIVTGSVTRGANPYLLPRLKAPRPAPAFAAALSGEGPWAPVTG